MGNTDRERERIDGAVRSASRTRWHRLIFPPTPSNYPPPFLALMPPLLAFDRSYLTRCAGADENLMAPFFVIITRESRFMLVRLCLCRVKFTANFVCQLNLSTWRYLILLSFRFTITIVLSSAINNS